LIRGPEVLEHSNKIDTVILDKTGTLTTGDMRVVEVVPDGTSTVSEVLQVASAVEEGSEHPLALAVIKYTKAQAVTVPGATNFAAIAGRGQSATVGSHTASVGQPTWLAESGFSLSDELATELAIRLESGHTVIGVGRDLVVLGFIVVSDTLKDSSVVAVQRLVELGLHPVMATGDNASVANRIAREVGIDTVYAGVTPEGKAQLVRSLQEAGHQVAMVGDGINDAPALATADLGIAMGTGTDAAMTAGDITIVNGDVRSVSDGIRLARRTLGTIRGNLFWAFAYNVAAIPLAVTALLNPIVAGLAMAFSSVFVVTNSLRLRSFRPTN